MYVLLPPPPATGIGWVRPAPAVLDAPPLPATELSDVGKPFAVPFASTPGAVAAEVDGAEATTAESVVGNNAGAVVVAAAGLALAFAGGGGSDPCGKTLPGAEAGG